MPHIERAKDINAVYDQVITKLEDNWYLTLIGKHIWALQLADYNDFLYKAASDAEVLRDGLDELSPLADDAHAIVSGFSNSDVARFKAEIEEERFRTVWAESTLPAEWDRVLMPGRFITAFAISAGNSDSLGRSLLEDVECQARGTRGRLYATYVYDAVGRREF
jgi:hypothetical protein